METLELIPIETNGFHAFSDAFALDQHSLVFISIAGHKDAVKAIRANILSHHYTNVGASDMYLVYGGKYATVTKTLPCGATHVAIYLKEADKYTQYALTRDPSVTEEDLYFRFLVKNTTVPVHPAWKKWLYKRAKRENEIKALTTHGIKGIKVKTSDSTVAEDISRALKAKLLSKDVT